MVTEVTKGAWVVVTTDGEQHVVPFDAVPYRVAGQRPTTEMFTAFVDGEPESAEPHPWAFVARLTMPGCIDASEWSGPYRSAQEALDAAWTEWGCPGCGTDDVARDDAGGWSCSDCAYIERV